MVRERVISNRGRQSKERIQAAAKAVAQRGEHVTYRSVAAEAGVASPLVSYYFRTAALLRAAAGVSPCGHCAGSGFEPIARDR